MGQEFYLSEDDRAILVQMLRQLQRDQGQDNTGQRPRVAFDPDDHPAPEVYVAKAPTAGIPALIGPGGIGTGTVGDEPGQAMCPVYRLQAKPGSAGFFELEPYGRSKVSVWNLSTGVIKGWFLAVRDKAGYWWAIPTAVGSGGGGGSASLLYSDGTTGTASVAANTVTVVTWSGLPVTAQTFMPAGGSTKFTIPNTTPFIGGGRFEVSTMVRFTKTPSGATAIGADYALRLFKNGVIPGGYPGANDWDAPGACSSNSIKLLDKREFFLSPGDYIEAYVVHNNTGVTDTAQGEEFSMKYLGAI